VVRVRPGNALVAVRNPHNLEHLKRILDKTDTRKIDIVVLRIKKVTPFGSGEYELETGQFFSDDVATLFSKVVSLAEKAGKHVELMVVPSTDPNFGIVETAQKLQSSLVVVGLSGKVSPGEQAKAFGDAWERLPAPRPQMSLQIVDPAARKPTFFNLGPHPPRLWPEDVELLHNLWLELSERGLGHKLHHRDVVRVALRRLEAELHSGREGEVVQAVAKEIVNGEPKPAEPAVSQADSAPQP
jgi:hypothetical protein